MDAELEDTQAEFQQLDDKMARVSQVATRIGDRLRVRPRMRAHISTAAVSLTIHLPCSCSTETTCFCWSYMTSVHPTIRHRSSQHGIVSWTQE